MPKLKLFPVPTLSDIIFSFMAEGNLIRKNVMLNFLVTGCAGFIGSHLTERLLEAGHSVTGMDNFSSFYPRPIKERNMVSFINHPAFEFHEVDLRDKSRLFDRLSKPYDVVAHLAAKAGVRPSIKDPEAYIDVNVKGTNNILELMRSVNCKKLFFASSSSVYGNQKDIPFEEFPLKGAPISPYAFTKRSCELMNYTYHHLYDFDIINARFFTVFGPRQRPDLAIHKFVKLAMEGEAITMFGDGSSARDYTYIDDTLSGIQKSIQYLLDNEHFFETINLGNNHPVQLSDLIALIFKATKVKGKIQQLPVQEGDVDITFASIDKAQKMIGYQPTTSMEAGLASFIQWYQSVNASVPGASNR